MKDPGLSGDAFEDRAARDSQALRRSELHVSSCVVAMIPLAPGAAPFSAP